MLELRPTSYSRGRTSTSSGRESFSVLTKQGQADRCSRTAITKKASQTSRRCGGPGCLPLRCRPSHAKTLSKLSKISSTQRGTRSPRGGLGSVVRQTGGTTLRHYSESRFTDRGPRLARGHGIRQGRDPLGTKSLSTNVGSHRHLSAD